ncbi:DUF4345 family protein [Candidatus Neomicrothrix sp.]|uniref:DUF4345 family protein n=1 Tax=Candidatus Neomicrothrix sp. TaxID=2719034 RepID=UPI000E7E822D|nr:DUF4345 family protein [Candidatus Microthrix sp.]NLH67021.1 DUF4345 family protein [Candidatus Microthrix parvicella]MBK7018720.1 DUF4345 family protein [Candidatus Microthrix sp.]MBK7321481.1 DUF4345 family protein [Candidatus Microthrix sp.]MBL0205695.1 DUF4345 family protein [Candidatus Microthrix sp.]MBP6133641.1 DUF4345 family protein [Candidatus Microthrix sp.]
MTLIDIAVVLVVGYFLVTGLTFLVRPESVAFYGLSADGPAGRTEVRCYYGALALGLGAFVGYLGLNDLGREAITGVLMIASAILVVRVIGAFADRGWSERYNRLAVPTETGFVVALGAVLFFG